MAYYALHKLHILPAQWVGMDRQEKAFIVAAIRIKVETEENAAKKLKKK